MGNLLYSIIGLAVLKHTGKTKGKKEERLKSRMIHHFRVKYGNIGFDVHIKFRRRNKISVVLVQGVDLMKYPEKYFLDPLMYSALPLNAIILSFFIVRENFFMDGRDFSFFLNPRGLVLLRELKN